LVEVHDLAAVKCCVAGHQIQDALVAVLVCKDLPHHKQRKADLFQPDFCCFAVFQWKRFNCLVAPAPFVLP